ncbi:hypothetical protein GGI12_005568 [Dipsacomyces acuminosporus]|nr:hypothetical protein GGI12_005568 [Dipsacomyces acuminosporus]
MIEQNTRLLVFTEDPAISDANTQKYFMPYADNVLKLDSAFSYGAEWTCAPYEFSTAYSLMLLPHYIQQTSLYNGKSYPNMPYPFNLGTTNGYQLEYHAIHCRGGKSLWVNYMQVDFYDKGDVFTPALKFNSLPFKGDDASNFVPKFYSGTAPVGGIMPLSSSATPVRSNTASMAIITSIMFAAWPLVARALRI